MPITETFPNAARVPSLYRPDADLWVTTDESPTPDLRGLSGDTGIALDELQRDYHFRFFTDDGGLRVGVLHRKDAQ